MQRSSSLSHTTKTPLLGLWKGFASAVASVVPERPRGPGRPQRVGVAEALLCRAYRALAGSGSLESHYEEIIGGKIAGSCCSRRLRKVDDNLLQAVNQAVLRPVGDPETSPESFWKQWRLVGIDGTAFLLQNTEQILAKVPKSQTGKAGSRRPAPAKGERKKVAANKADRDGGDKVGFPRIQACAMVELGTHAPLAAHLGLEGEGELTLAWKIIDAVQSGMLVLADKLYGRAVFVHALLRRCREVGSAFLIKIPSGQTSKLVETLSDGSRLVEVKLRSQKRPADIVGTFIVREICYTVCTTDAEGRPVGHDCRIWTNLLDPALYPADSLAGLMSRRWEHEIYYKETKALCPNEYLDSQLPETAAVEIMSLIWASALLARARHEAAAKEEETVISFSKTQATMHKLLWLVNLGRSSGILTEDQIERLAREAFMKLRQCVRPARRDRCCPRKVRRKQKQWPRLRRRTESASTTTIKVRQ